MKINLSVHSFAEAIGAAFSGNPEQKADAVAFDTRKISNPEQTVFFALPGGFRDGHDFIAEAYEKGIRLFVARHGYENSALENAVFLHVEHPLEALQKLAAFHRNQFGYPVVGITGSVGKTTVKEWIYHLISGERKVVRSPKSYNSQLGVALSLLEMGPEHEVALIEAGISQNGEMDPLREMIRPDYGVFTSLGTAHAENFASQEQHLEEKLKLFDGCSKTFYNASIQLSKEETDKIHGTQVNTEDFNGFLNHSPFRDKASLENLSLAIAVALELGADTEKIKERIPDLPRLALRMETFDGIQGNIIINDTYNLDLDALTQSLEYQLSIAKDRKRVAIIASEMLSPAQQQALNAKLEGFKLDGIYHLGKDEIPPVEEIRDSIVLIKGTRAAQLQRIAALFQLKKHKTRVEIDFSAARSNLDHFRSLTKPGTKLLVMVKASSYGSGAEKMAEFLEKSGVDYLGVAYADEGVELRKYGISLPILVMNAEEDGFSDIIQYNLEPAIFSFDMMDQFVKALIMQNHDNYPVHLKFDTGMHRLGFAPSDVERVTELLQAQPEIKVKGVYSHLADSDNLLDRSFSDEQISLFRQITDVLQKKLSYPFIRHILNTEGIERFPEADFEMVRMGIGLYGSSVNPEVQKMLRPAISWKSVVSQVKAVHPGESVGYSRRYVADSERKIAVIPVGYADGFRRSLGLGKGGMVVQGKWCPVLGSVCMDMTMIDVTGIPVFEGDPVEIIGETQTLSKLAADMETIPYEVLTSISKRVHRVYIEE